VDDDRITGDALAAGAGDRTALTRFVGATHDDVHRLCAYLVSTEEAGDLAQETYLRAIRALPGFRADAPARLWLLSIARRTCADHLRSRYRRRGIEDRIPRRADAVAAADPSLWALLDELDPDQRSAFVMTQLLGLTYQEAAAVAECPVGTIRSRVARARNGLVQLLRQAEAAASGDTRHPGEGNQAGRLDDLVTDARDVSSLAGGGGAAGHGPDRLR
jgi:RNA polymerase sigma-70 factor (ECF subfamily)